MSIEIVKAAPDITPVDIANLEQAISARLPDEYRRFLLENNGGTPNQAVEIDIPGLLESPTDIQLFFGAHRRPETSNILWYLQETPDRIPSDVIPIGCDSGGGLFYLVVRGKRVGHVDYLGYSDERAMPFPVSSSFGELLRKIRPAAN